MLAMRNMSFEAFQGEKPCRQSHVIHTRVKQCIGACNPFCCKKLFVRNRQAGGIAQCHHATVKKWKAASIVNPGGRHQTLVEDFQSLTIIILLSEAFQGEDNVLPSYTVGSKRQFAIHCGNHPTIATKFKDCTTAGNQADCRRCLLGVDKPDFCAYGSCDCWSSPPRCFDLVGETFNPCGYAKNGRRRRMECQNKEEWTSDDNMPTQIISTQSGEIKPVVVKATWTGSIPRKIDLIRFNCVFGS